MKPLSLDLRHRIVEAYQRGEGSRAALAHRFAVGKATVDRLLRQHRATGSLEPRPRGGSTPIVSEQEGTLIASWIEHEPDLTQQELADRLEQHTGARVSPRTMGRVRARLGLTRKKDPDAEPSPASGRACRTSRLPRMARNGGCDQAQSRR